MPPWRATSPFRKLCCRRSTRWRRSRCPPHGKERGLEPSALICRCGGEFAAAHVSGAIGFEDALEAPCRIASLIASGKGRGQIIVVRLSCEDARALSAECPVRCEMISEGDANSAVVGCSQEHAAAAIAFFTSKNIVATTTRLLFAAHTWLVEETSTALLYPLARPARPARLPIYSATARGLLPPIQDWARHFRRVVRDDLSIRAVIGAALDDGVTRFVEVGGWPSLRGFIESEAAARGLCLSSLATMERERPLRATMDETLEALGAPFVPA